MYESDYVKFRGRCKEYCEAAIAEDPSLTLVRGHYMDWIWGPQQHWWLKRSDGSIYDPTSAQFPTKGTAEYVEFDGYLECEYCGKSVREEDVYSVGHHVYCCGECYGHDVGF